MARLIAAVLLFLALAIRIGEVQRTSYHPINDAASYLSLAGQIEHSGDYSSHARGAAGTRGPSAYFPPAYPYFIAGAELLAGHRTPTVPPARYANVALGTVVVALTGLVAFEAMGGTVGLIALGLAAVYPVFVELSAVVVAENLFTALVLAAVYAGLRADRGLRPLRWIAAAGVLTGLATLTHENGIVLVLPLAFVAFLAANRTAKGPVLLVAAAILTVVPWTIRDAIELHSFIPVSDETGITLAGTYNPASAADHRIPYRWRLYLPERHTSRLAEPALNSDETSAAIHYIGHYPLALLKVAYHNLRRMFELEGSYAWEVSTASIDIPRATARIGVLGFWVVCALALAGAFTPQVRLVPKWLWAVPVLLALSVLLVNVETPRFREPIDPFLILPAACALAWILERLSGRAPIRRIRRAPLAARGGELVEMRQRLA